MSESFVTTVTGSTVDDGTVTESAMGAKVCRRQRGLIATSTVSAAAARRGQNPVMVAAIGPGGKTTTSTTATEVGGAAAAHDGLARSRLVELLVEVRHVRVRGPPGGRRRAPYFRFQQLG
jgi:hypothetical protein